VVKSAVGFGKKNLEVGLAHDHGQPDQLQGADDSCIMYETFADIWVSLGVNICKYAGKTAIHDHTWIG
jgi:hypothetical protein